MRRTADRMRQAEGEYKAAMDLYSTGNYAWSCFASQLAAEKALKEVLEHPLSPRVGHDLMDLVEEVRAKRPVVEEVAEACSRLTSFTYRRDIQTPS